MRRMQVIVFGADGLVGRRLVERALGRGHSVTAVGADERPAAAPGERLRMVRGDVITQFSFEHALAGQQAVLFALDADASDEAHSEGMSNVLTAMARHKVGRLVCLSAERREERSRGLGIFRPHRRAQATLSDLRRMEVLVRASGTAWTIVRPARVVDAPGRGRWRDGPGYALPGGSQIAAADVAEFMLDQLESDTNVRHAVAIAW
jgi:putative NADH-flavin reductase